jgi:hypothetical protein
LSYYWTQEGSCFNINQFFRWGTFCNIVTDLVMLILPIPVVLKLHLSLRLRLGILVTFILGSLYVPTESSIEMFSSNNIQWSDYFNSPFLRILHYKRRGRRNLDGCYLGYLVNCRTKHLSHHGVFTQLSVTRTVLPEERPRKHAIKFR